MANVNFAEESAVLQSSVPGAPRPLLSRAMREAVVEFCEESESYVCPVEGLDLYLGESEYEFDIPASTKVVKVWSLTYNSRPIKPSSIALLDQKMSDWRTRQATPVYFFYQNSHLTLAPVPSASETDAVVGYIALKPTRNAAYVDEDFYEENSQAIIDGALLRMYRMASQPWGDLMQAGVHKQLFDMAIEDAKSKTQQDHTAKGLTTSYGGL